jgi:hypothetical protein
MQELNNGGTVLVAHFKPELKAPGTKRLKLTYGWTAFKLCFEIQVAPLHNGRLAMMARRRMLNRSSKLKPPRTKQLKLNYDNLLSNVTFNFNLRCYLMAVATMVRQCRVTLSNPRSKRRN